MYAYGHDGSSDDGTYIFLRSWKEVVREKGWELDREIFSKTLTYSAAKEGGQIATHAAAV